MDDKVEKKDFTYWNLVCNVAKFNGSIYYILYYIVLCTTTILVILVPALLLLHIFICIHYNDIKFYILTLILY